MIVRISSIVTFIIIIYGFKQALYLTQFELQCNKNPDGYHCPLRATLQ